MFTLRSTDNAEENIVPTAESRNYGMLCPILLSGKHKDFFAVKCLKVQELEIRD